MYEALGRLLREARERLGVDQVEIASRLGVRQQAVSGWERGASRPRQAALRSLAAALGVEEEALLSAGAYRPAREVSAPARPLARSLPFGELPAERFEDVVTDVVKELYPEGHASRFGGSGEKQFGIDVLVKGGQENLATAQCKRHKQFGPTDVRNAVREVTITAERHHLFLSRVTATAAARTEMFEHANWQLWDGEDISRFIRYDMSPDRAIRLVDAYFPGHREAFLGVPQPSPWLPPEDYFLDSQDQVYTQAWTLEGRADELARLSSSLFASTGNLAAIVGRGGIGKTRLLRAVGEAAPDDSYQVRVLSGDAPVAVEDVELLPAGGRLVVLIDDAHQREDIAYLVAGIRRRNATASILLVSRPYGWNRIRTELSRAGFLPDSCEPVELGDLDPGAAEALAREALGQSDGPIAQRLAQLTLDCPLATVVGGVLIRRGQLKPSDLEAHDDVRDAIMRGFRESLASAPGVVDPDTRGLVLDVVAALQPFRTDEQTFIHVLKGICDKPAHVLKRHLDSLEDAGILRRRGASVRIAPDLLGDVILIDACYSERAGVLTGFLEAFAGVTDAQVLQHLLVNISRIDWQVRRRSSSSPSLVDALWERFEGDIRRQDIVGREQSVRVLSRVSYFQPRRVLSIARWLINNPIDGPSESQSPSVLLRRSTYHDVIVELPSMLRNAAYAFDVLPEVLDMLWELAQADGRPTNQYPNHPLRVITDFAGYETTKPVAYNQAVIDAAQGWFADGQTLSPFTALKPLFETEGSEHVYRSYTLTFQPFAVRPEVVGPLRARVIDLALQEAQSLDVKRAANGVHALETALRYPNGLFGRPVTSDERGRWTPEFVNTIRRIGEVASRPGLDPAILVAIRQALHWHATYSSTETRQAAEAVIEALPADVEARVALALHDGWGRLLRRPDEDYDVMQAELENRLTQTIHALGDLTDEEVTAILDARLRANSLAFSPANGHASPLVHELVTTRPSVAPHLIDHIIAHEAGPLASLLPVVLAVHFEQDQAAALSRARELVETRSADLTRGVAHALGWNRGRRLLGPGEGRLLLRLAGQTDPRVREAVVTAAQRLAREQPAAACELIAAVDFSDNPHLADEIFTCFNEKHYGLSWSALTGDQRSIIRQRLVLVADIDQHWVTSFLVSWSATDPSWVIDVLKERVTHAESLDSMSQYQAMPFTWASPLQVREHEAFTTHLRQLLAWLAECPDSWVRQDCGGALFGAVAGAYDESVTAVLAETLSSGNDADVRAVASALRKAPRTLIWDNPEFVSSALGAADRLSVDARKAIAGAFWGATVTGSRIGTPGQPFREDVEQRDKSTALADALPEGSVEQAFYRDMAASAQQVIARSLAEDRDDDGREW